MKWSTEAKAGVMVAASFLGLSGVLVAKKYLDPENPIEALAGESGSKAEKDGAEGSKDTASEKKDTPGDGSGIVLAKSQVVTPPGPGTEKTPGVAKELPFNPFPIPDGKSGGGADKGPTESQPGSNSLAKNETSNPRPLPFPDPGKTAPEKKENPFPAFPDPGAPNPLGSGAPKTEKPQPGNGVGLPSETKTPTKEAKGGGAGSPFPLPEPQPGGSGGGGGLKEFGLPPPQANKANQDLTKRKEDPFPPLGANGASSSVPASNPFPGLPQGKPEGTNGLNGPGGAGGNPNAKGTTAAGSLGAFPGGTPPEPLPGGAGLGQGKGPAISPQPSSPPPSSNGFPGAPGMGAKNPEFPPPGAGLAGSGMGSGFPQGNQGLNRNEAPLFNPVVPPARIQAATFSTATGPAKRTEFVPLDDEPPLARQGSPAIGPNRPVGSPSPAPLGLPGSTDRSGLPSNFNNGGSSGAPRGMEAGGIPGLPGGNGGNAPPNPSALPNVPAGNGGNALPGGLPKTNPGLPPLEGTGPVLRMPKEDKPVGQPILQAGFPGGVSDGRGGSPIPAPANTSLANPNAPVLRIPKDDKPVPPPAFPGGGNIQPVDNRFPNPASPLPMGMGGSPAAGAAPTISPKVSSWSEKVYLAQPGDTWESIAEKEYKKKDYARMVQIYNDLHPRAEPLPRTGPLPAKAEVFLPPLEELIRRGTGEVPLNAFPPLKP